MKVYCYLSDSWACGTYRQKFPAAAITDPGIDVEIIQADTHQVRLDLDMKTGRLKHEGFPRDADVVMLQRPSNYALVQAVPRLQMRGVAVVVDLDDDLAHIDPNNPAWMGFHPRTTTATGLPVMHSWEYVAFAARHATLVTVTTQRLADRYGAHGRVRVLPNCVPERFLDIPHDDSNVVGWAGAIHSHPGDCQAVGGSVARLVREGARFETVGDPTGIREAFGLDVDVPSTGTLAFDDWHPAVADRIGIGIAPLVHTRFCEAKSWLKPLEYASLGIPWVGSDLPSYRALHEEGCGLIAGKPDHWYRHLRRLVDSDGLRAELAEAGRDVARRWTYEDNAWRWAEAWSDAAGMVDARRAGYLNMRQPRPKPQASRNPRRIGRPPRLAKKGRKARIQRRR